MIVDLLEKLVTPILVALIMVGGPWAIRRNGKQHSSVEDHMIQVQSSILELTSEVRESRKELNEHLTDDRVHLVTVRRNRR
jgi:hypothetical protein